MSQNPNEGGYFTNLLNSNPQQYGGSSNPSTPSSQNSNSSSPYGTQQFNPEEFVYVHVWEVLKNYPKWDAEDPIDIKCLEDIFGPDKRPRPERDGGRKSRAAKKQKSTSTSSAASSGGSQTSTFSGQLSEKYSQKADVQMACYEARREKEVKALEMKEMKFLLLDPDMTSDPVKADIIRKRQAKIMKKYRDADADADDE